MSRPIKWIAQDIYHNWPYVRYSAKPYLAAMLHLDDIEDDYGHDSARSIIVYFLSNAQTWQGEEARRLKAELRELLGVVPVPNGQQRKAKRQQKVMGI